MNVEGGGQKSLIGRILRVAGGLTWSGGGILSRGQVSIDIENTGVLEIETDNTIEEFGSTAPLTTIHNLGRLRRGATTGTAAFGPNVAAGPIVLDNDGRIELDLGVLALHDGDVDLDDGDPLLDDLSVAITGPSAGSGYGQLQVTNTVTIGLDSTLAVSLSGFTPVADQRFTILTYGDRSGSFAGYSGLDIGGGLQLVPEFVDNPDGSGVLDLVVAVAP